MPPKIRGECDISRRKHAKIAMPGWDASFRIHFVAHVFHDICIIPDIQNKSIFLFFYILLFVRIRAYG